MLKYLAASSVRKDALYSVRKLEGSGIQYFLGLFEPAQLSFDESTRPKAK
jgi:hypothetical protein